jgi:hypothetical protein
VGKEKSMNSKSEESPQHFIIPISNFSLNIYDKDFTYIFDKDLKISLRKFDYENNIERVDADDYSNFDHGQLKMRYSWGLRFDCTQKELYAFIEDIDLLMLAFRIFDGADCYFKYILNVSNTHSSKKNPDEWKRAINTEKHSTNFTIESLTKIKEGYLKLQKFRIVSARTRHSIQFLYLGYISYYWMQAFILFMVYLETLVSPDIKSDKITSIIINRIWKLIPKKSICSKNQLNKIYDLRSDIVHGKIITDIELKKEMSNLVRLQRVVLSVFKSVMGNNFNTIYSNNTEFEKFFD